MALTSYRCTGVIVGFISVTLLSYYYFGRYSQYEENNHSGLNHVVVNYVESDDDISSERLQRLREGCSADGRTKYRITYNRSKALFIHSQKLNLSICKVPKAGSTFWTIVVLFVEKNVSFEMLFSVSGKTIHATRSKITQSLKTSRPLRAKRAVVSRDPYTRLFSAFTDKYFLLGFSKSAENLAKWLGKGLIKTESGVCGYNLTFQDFLDNITSQSLLPGETINRHWSPVYSLCRVCDVQYQYAIQQETMIRDTDYIIKQLNISKKMKTQLTTLCRGYSSNMSVKGMIKTKWDAFDYPHKRARCSSKLAYLKRMWEGFKIQGYIRTNISFPLSAFPDIDSVNVDRITSVVLTAMTTNPLGSERKSQRRQALVKAYADIPTRIISQIQEMYRMDFYLFGYDINPPS